MKYHTLGPIQIPDDVWWQDETDWTAVNETHQRGLTGALISQRRVKQHGRPITLTSNPKGGWVPRATVLALMAQRDVPAQTLLLTLADGRQFAVMHDRSREFKATPIRPAKDLHGGSAYQIELPLLTVAST